MPIAVTCSSCSADFQVKHALAGKRAECPECGELVWVPEGETAASGRQAKSAEVEGDRPRPRPRRDDPDDDRPRSKRRRDGDEDDRPRRRRRDEEDEKPKKRGNALPLILGIAGGLLFLCGGGCAGVWFGVIEPAAAKVRAEKERLAAEIERRENDLSRPPQASPSSATAPTPPQLPKLTQANVGRLRAGMTLNEVRAILGNEVRADLTDLATTSAGMVDVSVADRWTAKLGPGQVVRWASGQNMLLLALSGQPDVLGEVTVQGVLARFNGLPSEPIHLSATQPVGGEAPPTLTVAELAKNPGKYKDKQITLKGEFKTFTTGSVSNPVLVAPEPQTVIVSGPTGQGFDWKGQTPQPLELLEFTGKVGGTDRVILLTEAVLVSRTPNAQVAEVLTAEAFTAEFEKDMEAAAKKYDGKLVKVTGPVSTSGSAGIHMSLRGLELHPPGGKTKTYFVSCQFEGAAREAAKNPKLREPMTVVGRFSAADKPAPADSGAVTIKLKNCRVEK